MKKLILNLYFLALIIPIFLKTNEEEGFYVSFVEKVIKEEKRMFSNYSLKTFIDDKLDQEYKFVITKIYNDFNDQPQFNITGIYLIKKEENLLNSEENIIHEEYKIINCLRKNAEKIFNNKKLKNNKKLDMFIECNNFHKNKQIKE